MTIGIIVDNELYGDPRVNNEAKILQNAGFEIAVLCLNFGNYQAYEERNGIKICRIPIKKSKKNRLFGSMLVYPGYRWLWTNQIAKFIQNFSIDALHVNDLYMARAAKAGIRGTKIPIVLDLHENYPAAVLSFNWANRFPMSLLAQPKRWKKVEQDYLKCAEKIIVLSDPYKQKLLCEYDFLKFENIVVYPNVPDLNELLNYPVDTSILDKGNSFLLFYFGAIAERRGIFTTFEALKLLVNRKLDIKLLVIGPVDQADKQRFETCRQDPSLKERVIFYPWKDISLLPSYISISDACLSPLIKDDQHDSGVANKIFQYMLFERPIIVSDCEPQAEIIEEDKCGLYFKSGNAADFADNIEQLYFDKTLSKSMGSNGKKAVLEKYNTSEFSKKLIEVYNTLIRK
jgi:glycosyltransferase involved in cell wall biosynthesis